jgi:hypothetical protein
MAALGSPKKLRRVRHRPRGPTLAISGIESELREVAFESY